MHIATIANPLTGEREEIPLPDAQSPDEARIAAERICYDRSAALRVVDVSRTDLVGDELQIALDMP